MASGLRINRSSDDAASLSQEDDINSELRAISEGSRNIQQNQAHRAILVEGTDKLTFQVGPAGFSNDEAAISISDMRATGPTLNLADISLSTSGDARSALSFIQQAQRAVVVDRNRIASLQTRLERSIEVSEAVVERMLASGGENQRARSRQAGDADDEIADSGSGGHERLGECGCGYRPHPDAVAVAADAPT